MMRCPVSGLVADLPECLRAGQGARRGDSEDEREREPASPGLRARDQDQHRRQAGTFPAPFLITQAFVYSLPHSAT